MSTYAPSYSSQIKPYLPAIITLLVLGYTYQHVLSGLISSWSSSEDNSHGFLILPLFTYMLWQKKDELNTIPIKGSILGGILFFLSLCLYVIASAGGILTVTSLTLLTSFICGVWFLLGFELIRKIAFPLFFLLFMIPVPAQIYAAVTGPLQLLVTQVASLALKASSVPISCQGNVIEHPEQVFQVVQACSGLRSIMTMTTLGAVVGYFSMRTYWLRTLLILCGIPVAILVNILRVYILVGVYDWLRIDLAEGTAHTLFGVGVFVVSLGLFFLIYKWVSRWDK